MPTSAPEGDWEDLIQFGCEGGGMTLRGRRARAGWDLIESSNSMYIDGDGEDEWQSRERPVAAVEAWLNDIGADLPIMHAVVVHEEFRELAWKTVQRLAPGPRDERFAGWQHTRESWARQCAPASDAVSRGTIDNQVRLVLAVASSERARAALRTTLRAWVARIQEEDFKAPNSSVVAFEEPSEALDVERACARPPDVVVLDLSLRDTHAFLQARSTMQLDPLTAVVAFVSSGSDIHQLRPTFAVLEKPRSRTPEAYRDAVAIGGTETFVRVLDRAARARRE